IYQPGSPDLGRYYGCPWRGENPLGKMGKVVLTFDDYPDYP
ncbi:MAG: hypothetical protein QG657_4148, partial [Acidobacteriota bacterium]|nr:hypothetical protein [Acidobacteriota bacterium]